jgi:hypothetical protein
MKVRKLSFLVLAIVCLVFVWIYYFYFSTKFHNVFRNSEEPGRTDFSIVVIPDTQNYAREFPEIFTSQTQWIVDNKANKNIIFVIHEGDIVDDYNSAAEWNNANLSMSLLDSNNIPYGVLPGNHDMMDTSESIQKDARNTFFYNKYFPYTRYDSYAWYGGHYGDNNDNNYQLISYKGLDFLFLNMEFCPAKEVLMWANSIVDNYPGRRVIVTTHSYMSSDNTILDVSDKYDCTKYFSNASNEKEIWDNFIVIHKNIFLVLSGHIFEAGKRIDTGVNGNLVYQLLSDYQGEPKGGNGWLRILEFKPQENKIYISTYSPYLKEYKTDADNQFVLQYDMTSAKSNLIKADKNILRRLVIFASVIAVGLLLTILILVKKLIWSHKPKNI